MTMVDEDAKVAGQAATSSVFRVVTPPKTAVPLPENSAPLSLRAFDHIVLVYPDLEAAERWYVEVLGAKILRRIAWAGHVSPHSPHTDVLFGDSPDRMCVLSLFHGDPSVMAVSGPGLVHFAFRCPNLDELDQWKRHLDDKGVKNDMMGHRDLGPISIYFQDPWGYRLEITTKVPDWQTAKAELDKRGASALGYGPLSPFWSPGGSLR